MFTLATGECEVFADAVQLLASSLQSPSCRQCEQVLKEVPFSILAGKILMCNATR